MANAAAPYIDQALDALSGVYDYLKGDGLKFLKESVEGIWGWMTGDGLKMAMDAYKYFKTDMLPKITEFVEKLGPLIDNIVAFTGRFLQDPGAVFTDEILPEVLKWGGLVAAGIGATIIAIVKGPAIVAALSALLVGIITGPFGVAFLVGTAVIAALTTAVAAFGVEGIKDFVMKGWDKFTQGIKDVWSGIMDFFTGIINFDLGSFFSNLVPDSVKNSALNPMNWFGSSKTQAKAPTSVQVAEAESEVEKVKPITDKISETADSVVNDGTIALNTLMMEQNDLMRKQNKLLAKLDGNMLG